MNSPDDIILDFAPETPPAAPSYREFLASKMAEFQPRGFDTIPELHPALFPHQRDTTAFLLRVGRGAAFLDTGLGKTLVQLDWSRVVHQLTGKDVIILAPLAVAAQTVREGKRFGIPVTHALDNDGVRPGITITNYERLEKFDLTRFGGVVLDESSILKSFMGKTKQRLCSAFAHTPYRLCCTATPAPNDYMELGNHSDFLGIMPANEMLTRWFINDTMNFGSYRLKGHAVQSFWDWVCSWARCVSKPSDLGHDDGFYALPELEILRHTVAVDMTDETGENLFRMVSIGATEIHRENRRTTKERAAKIAELAAREPGEAWMIWCYTDYEADALVEAMPQAVEVRGSLSAEKKEAAALWFCSDEKSDGPTPPRILISKPEIFGFGLNFQHCARQAFMGVNYSYEQFYQALRRSWRFGQKRAVKAHIVMADTTQPVLDAVMTKAAQHEEMKANMFTATRRAQAQSRRIKLDYNPTAIAGVPDFLKSA